MCYNKQVTTHQIFINSLIGVKMEHNKREIAKFITQSS